MAAAWDEKEVFSKALSLPPEERAAYLKAACPDSASREKIEALLLHHAEIDDEFLTDPSKTMAPAPLPQSIGEFRILQKIGEGGMGVVYLANDTVLGRLAAVKVLASHLLGSEQALARFRTEARSAASLDHPSIVKVFKFDRDGDIQYIASEYVPGSTLANLITERRQQPASELSQANHRAWQKEAAVIIAAIADALECAHRANIIHRDVKPSNILIDKNGAARLTDFGIAKHLTEEDRSVHSRAIGSCHYMSPEQASIAGTRVDRRSDVFSLGVVLYELLSLRKPFDGPTNQQVLRAVVESEPSRLRTMDRRISKDLETICHKAIEKDPRDRYQTAAHIAADLRCFLMGVPPLARPASPVRRARRFLWLHRKAASVVLALCLTAAIFLLGWTIHFMRQESQAWFTVDVAENNCTVHLQKVNPQDMGLLPAELLGRTPLAWQSVPAGVYRLTIARPDDSAFVEFDVLMDLVGKKHATHFVVDGTGAMGGSPYVSPVAGSKGARLVRGRFVPTSEVIAEGMGPISAGKYPFGWSENDYLPTKKRTVALPDYYIDFAEVSNREYKEFCDATGYPVPRPWTAFGYESVSPDSPVVCVRFQDAQEYARWRGKRLPTMFEWHAAASGPGECLSASAPGEIPEARVQSVEDLHDFQSASEPAIFDAVRRFAMPVRGGTPHRGGFYHFCSNARELSGSIEPATSGVVVLGRCWKDAPRDLAQAHTASIADFSYVIGFRCAKSAKPCHLVAEPVQKGENHAQLSN